MTTQWFAESKAKLEWFGLTQGLIGETQRQGVTLVATLIGPRGIVRTLVPMGDWNNGTEYVPLDVVSSGGSSYLCITTNTNSEPPSGNWQLFAEAVIGPPGPIDSSNSTVLDIIKLTQSAYDALSPPSETTVYLITG